MSLPPIAQVPSYRTFADRRGLLGISSFLNVATNLAFLAVYWMLRRRTLLVERPGRAT